MAATRNYTQICISGLLTVSVQVRAVHCWLHRHCIALDMGRRTHSSRHSRDYTVLSCCRDDRFLEWPYRVPYHVNCTREQYYKPVTIKVYGTPAQYYIMISMHIARARAYDYRTITYCRQACTLHTNKTGVSVVRGVTLGSHKRQASYSSANTTCAFL